MARRLFFVHVYCSVLALWRCLDPIIARGDLAADLLLQLAAIHDAATKRWRGAGPCGHSLIAATSLIQGTFQRIVLREADDRQILRLRWRYLMCLIAVVHVGRLSCHLELGLLWHTYLVVVGGITHVVL